jgi:hypothetical protein
MDFKDINVKELSRDKNLKRHINGYFDQYS